MPSRQITSKNERKRYLPERNALHIHMQDLNQVNERIDRMYAALNQPPSVMPDQNEPLFLGVDIGTANVVSLVVNSRKEPVAGRIDQAHVVREGMIFDYFHALRLVEKQVGDLKQFLNRDLRNVVSAVPPGTEHNNGRVTRNLLEGAGLNVLSIIDEPTAAAIALEIKDGVVVDVGGGTTGVSILKDGKVVFSDDESTGGFQLDLVLAGGLRIPIEEAEMKKCDPQLQEKLFPVVRPVFEKIITITHRCIKGYDPEIIYLVGGTSTYPGFAELMQKMLGIPTVLPVHPLLVTPLGMALSCADQAGQQQPERKLNFWE